MIQLLQALFSTMRFEQQPKWQDKSTRLAAGVVKLESESASPPTPSEIQSKTTTRSRTKHDIDGDIKRLEEVFFGGHPMQSGFIIETTLHDLLAVCPRERRRKDAYKSLIHALNKMGVELIIKTK
jgi:nanoRNase/pAp phosphatase (c-di-AMP/oligoRNAs hydrolase)